MIFVALLLKWIESGGRDEAQSLGPGVIYRHRVDLVAGGAVHVVEVDLRHPQVRLFIREGESTDGTHRLDYVWRWVHERGLVAGINANHFGVEESLVWRGQMRYRVGAASQSGPPILIDGRVQGKGGFHYVVRFDDRNQPEVVEVDFARRYVQMGGLSGIGLATWGLIVDNGEVGPDHKYIFRNNGSFERTTLGWDALDGKLWMFAFERATMEETIGAMIAVGVKQGIMLDSGGSTCMVVDPRGRASGRTVLGGYRPVASMFGIGIVESSESIEQK